ncbi:MAG: tetratricopeptide repeat protein [Xanthobacteraceae bacterium]|nr:tetratricopeptide repeat protein [Xanthobacteraceae bacterium]
MQLLDLCRRTAAISDKGRGGSGGRNAERNFHGETREYDTHCSTTGPDARPTEADGTAERATAPDMIEDNARPGSMVGSDDNDGTADFVAGCRSRGCTPHVSQNNADRRSMGPGRLALLVLAQLASTALMGRSATADDRGLCFKNETPPDAAIQACSRLIAAGGNQVAAYHWRGAAYQRKGDYDRAIADFDNVVKSDPRRASAYASRGAAYFRKLDCDRANADFNQAIWLDPKEADAFRMRGQCSLFKGDVVRARPDLDEAIRLDPKSAVAYVARGMSANMQRRFDDAIRDLDEAIRLQPKNVGALTQRGVALRERGDFDRALSDLNQAIGLYPRAITAFVTRGLIQEQRGDVESARRDFASAAGLEDEAKKQVMGPNSLNLAQSRIAGFLTTLDEAIRRDATAASPYRNRAMLYEQMGRKAEAVADYRKTLLLDPADRQAAEGLQRLGAKPF